MSWRKTKMEQIYKHYSVKQKPRCPIERIRKVFFNFSTFEVLLKRTVLVYNSAFCTSWYSLQDHDYCKRRRGRVKGISASYERLNSIMYSIRVYDLLIWRACFSTKKMLICWRDLRKYSFSYQIRNCSKGNSLPVENLTSVF